MGRNGISAAEVMAAAERLTARGRKVTVTRIREELGDTGSYSTISAALKQWRRRCGEAPPDEGATDPPQTIRTTMLDLAGGLWRGIRLLVEKAVRENTRRSDENLQRLSEQLTRSDEALQDLMSRWADLSAQLREKDAAIHRLESELDASRRELAALREDEQKLGAAVRGITGGKRGAS